ncbi:hypothetical protein [uncultured Imperialibacter sp.]|uniref:hypothetical protein n=1 Tax=uncultured Imperialibacter sp. TaxID=1672639 RepID=UPI0030D6CE6F|tara:strand:+ start:4670 stop:6022 length:1353 start_codon:yes stop_codon:yes gene_type:complete
MLRISKTTGIGELERLAHELEKSPTADFVIDHALSEYFQPGVVAAAIQVIASWCRKSSSARMITNLASIESVDKFLTEMHLNPHLLVAILMTDLDKVYYSGGQRSIDSMESIVTNEYRKLEGLFNEGFSKVLEQQIRELKVLATSDADEKIGVAIKRLSLIKKENEGIKKAFLKYDRPSYLLSTFDHIPRLSHPRFFYDNKLNIKNEDQLSGLIGSMLKNSKFGSVNEIYQQKGYLELAGLIKELFQNTDSCAKIDFRTQKKYSPNIRSVYFGVHSASMDGEDIGDDPVITYINNLAADRLAEKEDGQKSMLDDDVENKRQIGLFEISVIDSGPGLASHISKNHDIYSLDIATELRAVQECFKKNMTSDTSSINFMKGRGLARVIGIVKNKGFIKVRTGRLSLFRDFYKKGLDLEEINSQTVNFSYLEGDLAKLEGTLISVFYPFTYAPK